MSENSDFRDFIVDHPSCRAATQLEYMDGATYTNFHDLLRSIRPNNTVRIFRPFLLGDGKGRTDKQRRIWAERADQIDAKCGKLVSIKPPLSGRKLQMLAYEEIGNVARGKAGNHKSGRPRKHFEPEQWATIHNHWPRRTGVKIEEAVERINKAIAPRKVSAGWLYANVK